MADSTHPMRDGRLRVKPARLVMMLCLSVTLTACGQSSEDMLSSARDYLAKNDINAASIQLKNALQKDGTIAEARYLLGLVYLQQGDVPGAVRELRRASELGYPAREVLPLLSRAMVLAGDFDRVVSDFANTQVDDAAAQARILTNVGDALLARAEIAAARGFYESALVANPDDVDARVGLARSMLFAGEVDAALAEAEAIVAQEPGNADAHGIRAEVYRVQQRRDDVITALDAAIAGQPGAVNYHYMLVSVLLEQERFEEAESRLEAMKRVARNHPGTLYLQAFMDFRKNNLEAAREGVDEVLRQIPNHLLADLLAGNIHLRLNDHVRARQHLERVVARAPGHALARRSLAASYLATGDAARARETLDPLLGAEVQEVATMSLAGQIYLASGDFERASDYFAQVSAANPEDVRARTSLGLARMAGGESEAAFADLEAAAALDETAAQPDVVLILSHLRAGEFDKALSAHEQLARKLPDHPQTHNLKGGILLAMGDQPGARAAFEKALEAAPGFLSAVVNLARIDLAENRPEDAKARLEAVISQDPARPDPYILLADLQRQTGANPADVKATLQRAVTANPTARVARAALARQLVITNELPRALSIAQELAAAEPDDPTVLGVLAQVQFSMGDRQQAISTLNRIIRLQPQSPAPLLVLAEVQYASNDRVGAEQSLRRALGLRGDWLEAQQRLVVVLAEQGKSNEAVAVAREVQQQRSEAMIGYALEGDVHAAAGRWEDAARAYASARERGGATDVAVKEHRSLLGAGKQDEAATAATRWLADHPQDVGMRAYLAEQALATSDFEEAERLYRAVVALQPENPLILNNLAWVAGQLGKNDAIALAERALALAPESAAILDTLGMLQVEAGQHEQGLSNLRKAVDAAPDQPVLRLNLAKAFIKMERKADAARELDEVIRLAPEGSPISQEAARMKEAF